MYEYDDGVHETMELMKKITESEKKPSDNFRDAVIVSGPEANDPSPLTNISLGKILELTNGMQCKVSDIKIDVDASAGFVTYVSITNINGISDKAKPKKIKAEDLMKIVVGEVQK